MAVPGTVLWMVKSIFAALFYIYIYIYICGYLLVCVEGLFVSVLLGVCEERRSGIKDVKCIADWG